MRFARFLAAGAIVAAIFLLSSDGVISQDRKDAPKIKGQIPPGWGKLNLTAAQKQSIYAIQSEYKEKIQKLEDEIAALKTEQQKKMVAVLTAEQKKQLTAGLTGEGDAKERPKDKGK
jgi:Spy/CpxP family protein refolding chaperone